MCYKSNLVLYLLLFIISCFLNIGKVYANSSDDCYGSFNQRVTKFRKIFSNPESYKKYKGLNGLLLFVEEHGSNLSLTNIQDTVLTTVNLENFKKLEWRHGILSGAEFNKIRRRFKDEKGQIKTKFIGKEGQTRYENEFCGGDKKKARLHALEVLNKIERETIKWEWIENRYPLHRGISETNQ